MNRSTASQICRDELDKNGLKSWGVRITSDPKGSYLGMCVYKDKVIILNAFHIDIHPDLEVIDTIFHEIAHALTPGHNHDGVWASKAREIGCTNTKPCSHLSLPEHIINAIRSRATVEMTVEEEIHTQIIRIPRYKVTRLQDKCPDCGKVAIEKFAVETHDREGNLVKLITLECFHIIKKVFPKGTAFDSMVSNDWKDEVKICKHDWNKNQCKKCGEFKLYDFQIKGAQATESGLATQKGFGIFDDMGLGKTVQALSYIRFHPKQACPALIITKSAIKFQWLKQILRWLGPDYLSQIISTSKDFVMPGLKTYIISYDLLRRFPSQKLAALNIKLAILDECQQIKNPDSTRTQEVRKLVSNNECKIIGLSGTPWKNRGNEFFPILNLIDAVKFYSHQNFLDKWVDKYYEGAKMKLGGIKNPSKFKEYTADLLIRREFNEVIDEFPDINRMKLNIQLDDLSQSTYDESVSEFVEWYNEAVIGGEEDNISGIELIAKMSRMRHIVGLAKIPATLGFVEEFLEDTDKKLTIFVHHKDVGQLMYGALIDESGGEYADLAKEIRKNGIRVFKYTSELSDSERFDMQELFNKTPRAIMIASTLACGEGVDLQTCADSIMHERQWNPQNEDQAAPGRFRRIGQTSKVINITFPEAEGTIDEYLDVIVERKRRQFHEVMNKGEVPVWNEGAIAKEIAEIIVKKHQDKKKGTNITSKAMMVKK